jgi:hypothetical protein
MTLDLLTAQLTDPFRIGLLIAMVYTARNTAAQAGRLIPVILGIVFVAILIPMTLGSGAPDRTTAIAMGLLSNAIIVAIIWAIWEAVTRASRK